jgi:hypothetical protein
VGGALPGVRGRGARGGVPAHPARHRPARHLLRLLLRHRPDLRRQEVDARDPRPGAGVLRVHHLRRRDAHRRAGGRERVQPLPRRRPGAHPRPVADLLVLPGDVRPGGAGVLRPVLPRARAGRRGRGRGHAPRRHAGRRAPRPAAPPPRARAAAAEPTP